MCHVVPTMLKDMYHTEPTDFIKLNWRVKNYVYSMIIQPDFSMFCAVKSWDHS